MISKYINNIHDFNIICKKCDSTGVILLNDKEELVFVCKRCEEEKNKDERLEKLNNDNNQFIKDIIVNYKLTDLKILLQQVLNDSNLVLNLNLGNNKKVSLKEIYELNCDNNKIFNYPLHNQTLSTVLKKTDDLKVINRVYTEDDNLCFTIDIFSKSKIENSLNEYKFNCNRYNIVAKVHFSKYKAEVKAIYNNSVDLVLDNKRIRNYIDNIKEEILILKKVIGIM